MRFDVQLVQMCECIFTIMKSFNFRSLMALSETKGPRAPRYLSDAFSDLAGQSLSYFAQQLTAVNVSSPPVGMPSAGPPARPQPIP